MKILNPYRFIKGSGGKDAPVPKLIPPSNQALKKSISVMQNVDILCEGPIYGLVDQFGKKVYGLDMLKGVYLNGTPVMNNSGQYNFRNILMEINLGTENQKPLPSFKNVEIFKPANFKLLGPIRGGESDIRPNSQSVGPSVEQRDFTQWARTLGDWPSEDKDPFIFVHKIRNRDVTKLKVSFVIEALMDTVDQGIAGGEAKDMGMSRATSVELLMKYGLENADVFEKRPIIINGTVQSPYAYMVGEGEPTLTSTSSPNSSLVKGFGGSLRITSSAPILGNSLGSQSLSLQTTTNPLPNSEDN